MRTTLIALPAVTAALFLSACASSPESIQAASVDPAQYGYLDCRQLAEVAAAITVNYKRASDQEDNARAEDVIGYVVLQQPLGAASHAGTPAEISNLKGQMLAVQSVESSKNCTPTQAASLGAGTMAAQ